MSNEADANKDLDPKEFESLFKSMNPDVVDMMALSYSFNQGLNDTPEQKLADRRGLQRTFIEIYNERIPALNEYLASGVADTKKAERGLALRDLYQTRIDKAIGLQRNLESD